MKSSIKDVARRAGVSIATVSHVINNTHYVSDEKKKRVLSAIEGLNYKPNKTARSLRSKRSGSASVVIDTEYSRQGPTILNRLLQDLTKVMEEQMYGLAINFANPIEIIRLCEDSREFDCQIIVTHNSNQYAHLLKTQSDIILLDMDLMGIANDSTWRENEHIAFISRHFYNELANRIADDDEDSACYLITMEQMKIMKALFHSNVNYEGIYQRIKVIDSEVSAAYVALNDILAAEKYQHVYLSDYKFALGAVKLFLLKPELLHLDFTITYLNYDRPFENFAQPVTECKFICTQNYIEEAILPFLQKCKSYEGNLERTGKE